MSRTVESPKPTARTKPKARKAGPKSATDVGRRRGASVPGAFVRREPRVDLLPGEVHVERRERALSRRAWLGVVVVTSAVVLAVAGATVVALGAEGNLQSAQAQTSSLLAQQGKYSEVRRIEGQSKLLAAAQGVGGASEIDWSTYLGQLQAALPGGASISDMTITSASPIANYPQSTVPLQGARVATLDVTLQSQAIPSVPAWTEALSKLDGYVDSDINSVVRNDDTNGYTATVTLHVDEKAYDGKYTKEDAKSTSADSR